MIDRYGSPGSDVHASNVKETLHGRSLSFSQTFSSAIRAWRRISVQSVLRWGISLSEIEGQQYLMRWRKPPRSISQNALEEWVNNILLSSKVTYLIFTHHQLNNVVKKACGCKRWLLGFTSYHAIQTQLVEASSLISNLTKHRLEHWTYLSLDDALGIRERARGCGVIPNFLHRSR